MTLAPGPIVALALEFGTFPEITPLNPRFVPGRRRLKLTLDVEVLSGFPGLRPAGIWDALRETFPILSRHRCGDVPMGEAFAVRSPSRASGHGTEDDDVAIAHLLEHLVIDCQCEIAGMTSCSGITCGFESPRNRFDIFIESPATEVSRLCVALATALLNDLARGRPADPVYAGVVALARRFRRAPSDPMSRASAARLLGDTHRSARALAFLQDLGFITEIETCINFSSVPIFRATHGAVGLDLRSA